MPDILYTYIISLLLFLCARCPVSHLMCLFAIAVRYNLKYFILRTLLTQFQICQTFPHVSIPICWFCSRCAVYRGTYPHS